MKHSSVTRRNDTLPTIFVSPEGSKLSLDCFQTLCGYHAFIAKYPTVGTASGTIITESVGREWGPGPT
ncbi:Uncharacterized protein HZ326_8050 [Fusarium oxysporum f. sp. albedinis]|nr:Uncharacterized protein HZ326_8050 [Fusarium oxysporum f. sp. albedinis]